MPGCAPCAVHVGRHGLQRQQFQHHVQGERTNVVVFPCEMLCATQLYPGTGYTTGYINTTVTGSRISLNGLAVNNRSGILWGYTGANSANFPSRLVTFANPADGLAVVVGSSNGLSLSSLAWHPNGNTLYAYSRGQVSTRSGVFILNTVTGAAVGPLLGSTLISVIQGCIVWTPANQGVTSVTPRWWRILPIDCGGNNCPQLDRLNNTGAAVAPATFTPLSLASADTYQVQACAQSPNQANIIYNLPMSPGQVSSLYMVNPTTRVITPIQSPMTVAYTRAFALTGYAQTDAQMNGCPYTCTRDDECTVTPWLACNSTNLCTLCPAGKYNYFGLRCEPCPINTFTTVKGRNTCSNCTSGRYSAAGSSSCANCPTVRPAPFMWAVTGFASQTRSLMFKLYPGTGFTTGYVNVTVGGTSRISLNGLAMNNRTGLLYGITSGTSETNINRLVSFTNPANGVAVVIGATGISGMNAIAWSPDGLTLWMYKRGIVGQSSGMFKLNPTTAAVTGPLFGSTLVSSSQGCIVWTPANAGLTSIAKQFWRLLPKDCASVGCPFLDLLNNTGGAVPASQHTPLSIGPSFDYSAMGCAETPNQANIIFTLQTSVSGDQNRLMMVNPTTNVITQVQSQMSVAYTRALALTAVSTSSAQLNGCPYTCTRDDECTLTPWLYCNSTSLCALCPTGRYNYQQLRCELCTNGRFANLQG